VNVKLSTAPLTVSWHLSLISVLILFRGLSVLASMTCRKSGLKTVVSNPISLIEPSVATISPSVQRLHWTVKFGRSASGIIFSSIVTLKFVPSNTPP